MKDFLEKILGYLPAYLRSLLRLVQAPKSFVSELLLREKHQEENALVFLTISFLIQWILKASFVRQEFYTELAADSAFILVLVLLCGFAIWLAWRVVGGAAKIQKVFVVHFYYSGVLILLFTCWFLAITGTLRAFNASLYAKMLDSVYHADAATFFKANGESIIATPGLPPVIFIGLMAVLTWTFAGWGAYRQLNGASRLRSLLAAMLFIILWFPITVFALLLANSAIK